MRIEQLEGKELYRTRPLYQRIIYGLLLQEGRKGRKSNCVYGWGRNCV